jgi:outer membrane protein TolC
MELMALAAGEQADSVRGHGGLQGELSLMALRTDSPLSSFGLKLNQGRITQMDFDPAGLNDPDYIGNVETKLTLMYPLFTSGRIRLMAEALKKNSAALDFDALAKEHELMAKVIEAYFNHALLAEQLVVLDDARLTLDELKRMIEQMYSEGLVIRTDILAAEVELANLEQEVTRAEEYQRTIEETLAILTGGEVAAGFRSEVPLELTEREVPDGVAAEEDALANRPELKAMELRVQAAGNMLAEAVRKRNPTIGLFATGANNDPQYPFGDDGHTEVTYGAQLLLDLDFSGITSNEIDQKRAELEAAMLGLEQLEDMARIDVAQALAEVRIAREAISAFATQAEKAAENLRVVRNRYEEGLTNFLDLRMAVTTHKESRLRYVKAEHDYLLAYIRLLVATGQLGTAADPFLGEMGSGADNGQGERPGGGADE